MTAVMGIAPLGYPVLIGDVLTSGRTGRPYTKPLPTHSEPSTLRMQRPDLQILGLRQKLCIINNIALGWSGKMLAAREVWQQLQDASQGASLTPQEVNSILTGLESHMRANGVGVLGFVRHADGDGSFGFNCAKLETDQLGTARVMGSGADTLKGHIGHFLRQELAGGDGATNEERAFGLALLASANILAEELTTSDALSSYFGGGYELCTLDETGFVKRDDITYIWWTGEVSGGEIRITQPRRILRQYYVGDILILRSIDVHGESKHHAFDDQLFAVQPLDRDLRGQDVSVPRDVLELNLRFSCHMISYTVNGKVRCLSRAVINDPDGPPVLMNVSGRNLEIDVRESFLEELGAEIRSRGSV